MLHGITLSKKQCPSSYDEQERLSVIPYALAIGFIMYTMLMHTPRCLLCSKCYEHVSIKLW
jgi:hypothetical protein